VLLYNGGMAKFSIVPVTGAIGAEIRGIDLTQTLGAASVRAVEEALHEHLVLFFRDQKIGPA
jgi:taurine dioxygenase